MRIKKEKIFFLLFMIFTIIIIGTINIDKEYIELTQLHDNIPSQMMGYFVKTSNGKNIVIDGGTPSDSENLQKYINQNGGKVDYWFITHFHTDHTGALADILNNTKISIDKIIYHEVDRNMVEQYEPSRLGQYDIIHEALKNERIKGKIIDPKIGQVFQISSNINVKIINVYENDITENFGNNTSTVYKLKIKDKSVLFLGDTGVESSQKLLKNYKEELKSDYVQMAHHGQQGVRREFYDIVDPSVCLWPTPDWLWENNQGGKGPNTGPWKTLETRAWVKEMGIEKNFVSKDGLVKLTF